jgi:hypothetical protein
LADITVHAVIWEDPLVGIWVREAAGRA